MHYVDKRVIDCDCAATSGIPEPAQNFVIGPTPSKVLRSAAFGLTLQHVTQILQLKFELATVTKHQVRQLSVYESSDQTNGRPVHHESTPGDFIIICDNPTLRCGLSHLADRC